MYGHHDVLWVNWLRDEFGACRQGSHEEKLKQESTLLMTYQRR